MDEELKKQIQTRMAELPADVRAAIQSADFGTKMQAIGAKHQLHIDQEGKLEDEVLLVMLAFSSPDAFVQNLVEQLQISEDVANQIADEVSTDILQPIRQSMQAFMEAHAARNIHDAARESLDATPPVATPVLATPPTPAVVAPKSPTPAPSIPLPTPTVTTATTQPPAPAFPVADTVLAGKTITMPQVSPAQTPPPTPPRPYTADPYHEPIE